MNDRGYSRRLRMLTNAYESGATVNEETAARISDHADSHSSIHPDEMTADPLAFTPEERRMAGGMTLFRLRR